MDIEKWITPILALLFSIALLGLVIYTITWTQNEDLAKISIGFSAGLLGTILGFYFNNRSLVNESNRRDLAETQRDEYDALRTEIQAELSAITQEFINLIEQEPDDPDDEVEGSGEADNNEKRD